MLERERTKAIQALLVIVLGFSHWFDKRAPLVIFATLFVCYYSGSMLFRRMQQDLEPESLSAGPTEAEEEEAASVQEKDIAVHSENLLPLDRSGNFLLSELVQHICSFMDFTDVCHAQALNTSWMYLFLSDPSFVSLWDDLYRSHFGDVEYAAALASAAPGKRAPSFQLRFKSRYLMQLVIRDNRQWCARNQRVLCSNIRHNRCRELAENLAAFPPAKFGAHADGDAGRGKSKSKSKSRSKVPFADGRNFQAGSGTIYTHLLTPEERVWHVNAAVDGKRASLLSVACANGHRRACEVLLGKGANVDHQDAFGNTPLHVALHHNHAELASWLIAEHGADDTVVNIASLGVYDGMADLTHLPM